MAKHNIRINLPFPSFWRGVEARLEIGAWLYTYTIIPHASTVCVKITVSSLHFCICNKRL